MYREEDYTFIDAVEAKESLKLKEAEVEIENDAEICLNTEYIETVKQNHDDANKNNDMNGRRSVPTVKIKLGSTPAVSILEKNDDDSSENTIYRNRTVTCSGTVFFVW